MHGMRLGRSGRAGHRVHAVLVLLDRATCDNISFSFPFLSLSLSLERNLALEFFHRCSDVCVYVYIYGDTRATFRNV